MMNLIKNNIRSIMQILCFTALLVSITTSIVFAQRYHPAADPKIFEKLTTNDIPGAPKLSKPILMESEVGPISAHGMGWAAPMLFDVDGDGLEDMVIGEFASGFGLKEKSTNQLVGALGNLLRVYPNVGTKENPDYSNGSYFMPHAYRNQEIGFGGRLSVWTWCCMAFTPRLADLDGDGIKDLATGVYDGDVVWFKGLEGGKGFNVAQKVPQFEKKFDPNDQSSAKHNYWAYSIADFVDIDGDGRQDAIFGGHSLKYALNKGNGVPELGERIDLKDQFGDPLHIWDPEYPDAKKKLEEGEYGAQMVPTVVDWDNDGVEDLLVTNHYAMPGRYFITFFKGVRKNGKLSFLKGVPLFKTQQGAKIFPGSWPVLTVADWNNDGIKDLIIGISMTTNYGRYSHDLSWQWEIEAKTAKQNPAFLLDVDNPALKEDSRRIIKADSVMRADNLTNADINNQSPRRYTDPVTEYRRNWIDFGMENVAHIGYVYVLLGEK